MHRSSLYKAVLGWKPLAPPLFPVVTFRRTVSAFSTALRSRNPQKHPFLPYGFHGRLVEHPWAANLGSPTSI